LGNKVSELGIKLGLVLGFSESGPKAATCVSGSSLKWNVVVALILEEISIHKFQLKANFVLVLILKIKD